MKTENLSTVLREIADRMDAMGLPEGLPCSIEFDFHNVKTREDLSRVARFAGLPLTVNSGNPSNWLRRYTTTRGESFGVVIFYESGLLGGSVRQVVEDDETGLEKLLAEQPADADIRFRSPTEAEQNELEMWGPQRRPKAPVL